MIVLPCKLESIPVRPEDYLTGYNYALLAKATLLVAVNKLEKRILKVPKQHTFPKLEKVLRMPDVSMVNGDEKIKELLIQVESLTRRDLGV
ncbi:MAG: hypothetical protein AAF770_03645 [Bacteroidota bacterium]